MQHVAEILSPSTVVFCETDTVGKPTKLKRKFESLRCGTSSLNFYTLLAKLIKDYFRGMYENNMTSRLSNSFQFRLCLS